MARLFRILDETGDRLWIELTVTREDIERGLNTRTAGPKLFTGLWYGKDPFDHRSYGKIMEPRFAVPVGRIGKHAPLRTVNRLK